MQLALGDDVTGYRTSSKCIGGVYGLAQRLELRYTAQIKALDAEAFRANVFLREMGSGEGGRVIEAYTEAHVAELQQKLETLMQQLGEASMEKMMAERAEGAIVARLADIAAARI